VEFSKVRNGKTSEKALLNGDGGIRIIHVGGFTFEKNHAELIEIFELILKKTQSAYLYLVGDGPLKGKIEEVVREKGLGSRIKFCGFQKNAMDYIRNADVLVLPSVIEGLPGVILEAFYCKTPVVAYNVGGIREIVKHKETGRLITQGDKSGFANAVVEASIDTPQNEKIIQNAHRLVMTDYLNREVVKKFLTAYESLVI
jgi:glycosyltransferase involved in cell wall biosynthesis